MTAQLEIIAGTIKTQLNSKIQKLKECETSLDRVKDGIRKASEVNKFAGPCVKSLETSSKKLNIQQQAFFGGAFIVNFVQKCLKKSPVITYLVKTPGFALQQGLLAAMGNLTMEQQESATSLKSAADELTDKYTKLFNESDECHKLMSKPDAATAASLHDLTQKICQFMSSIRTKVVNKELVNITPELHMIEDHIINNLEWDY